MQSFEAYKQEKLKNNKAQSIYEIKNKKIFNHKRIYHKQTEDKVQRWNH